MVTGRPSMPRDDARVELVLLLLVGELAVGEERELGAVEADALGAVAVRERQVGDEPDVGVEGHAPAVGRLRGQAAQRLELAVEGAGTRASRRSYSRADVGRPG